jgi:hypothetical protein
MEKMDQAPYRARSLGLTIAEAELCVRDNGRGITRLYALGREEDVQAGVLRRLRLRPSTW